MPSSEVTNWYLNMMKRTLFLILILFTAKISYSQQMEQLDAEVKIICYSSGIEEGTKVLPTNHYHPALAAYRSESTGQNGGATFEVTYIGFTEQAKQAFQRAVDIWASYISSDVVIRVEANWRSFDQEGVLGSAIWGTAYRGFEGALNNDTWYPVALAEKMAERELNSPNDPDIVANFNRGANWYLGTDGQTSGGETDLVSVVLHELGHGLGFIDSYNINEDTQRGSVGIQGFPFTFDRRVETDQNVQLSGLVNFPDSLADALTSGKLFFNSPSAITNDGQRPKLYAPSEWNGGSSIAHLDETTYPAGTPNSLMSPFIGRNEVIQEPGQITLDMFGDMGWEYTYIENINRPNSDEFEADNFLVTASIKSDVGYLPESVKLFYSNDGFQSDNNEVVMTPTGTADQFSATITSTKTEDQVYSYYISVVDVKARTFSRPSLVAAQRYLQFSTSQDSEAPVITHTPPNFVRAEDERLALLAIVEDYLPVNVQLEYSINGGTAQTVPFQSSDPLTSTYAADVVLGGLGLQEGDKVSYRILATDIGRNANNSIFPETGLIELTVTNTPAAITQFSTDFNDLTSAANDFQFSADFSIREESGFSNGALHSAHPYANGTGANSESNYTIELKAPVLIQNAFPIISFDEVALIEAGESGSVFGDNDFCDYVIVEGSKDGGSTWLPLVDGYDNRASSSWEQTYNSNINADGNSEAVGDQSLFVNRQINILENGNFVVGDEIIIRFRLFADQAARGWGWVIDNLKVQVDDLGPTIVHNHLNFVSSLDDIEIAARVTDNAAVDSVGLLVRVNGQAQDPIALTRGSGDNYQANLNISSLQTGDLIEYRLAAFDNNSPQANASFVPSASEFIQVPIISFENPVDLYANDFNSETTDFVGNFYSIDTPTGFNNGAIHSDHPYRIGYGVLGSGAFTYMLKTPIRIDEQKALLIYDEVVLVDPTLDFTAVEASKDNGETWFEIIRYGTNDFPDVWRPVFDDGESGSEGLFRERRIEMTQSPQINDGDIILLRFKLERRGRGEGWGWAIDNLEIQTEVIASLEAGQEASYKFSIFPNPVEDNLLTIQLNQPLSGPLSYSIISSDGVEQLVLENISLDSQNTVELDISALRPGLFILKIQNGEYTEVFKVLKLK